MISAKYNSPSPPTKKKNKNKQTNKKQTRQNKTNKQTKSKQGKKKTNKQTKAKTKNMWGFVFPKCCGHQGYWRIIFWEKKFEIRGIQSPN